MKSLNRFAEFRAHELVLKPINNQLTEKNYVRLQSKKAFYLL